MLSSGLDRHLVVGLMNRASPELLTADVAYVTTASEDVK
jgi:hypothetical protein